MESPFLFGKVIGNDAFTNRVKDIKRLKDNFTNRIHTILISPRRWGKSSLVKKTAEEVAKESKNIRFCFVDLFNVRSEEEFYEALAQASVKAMSGKLEEWLAAFRRFLYNITPQVTIDADHLKNFKLKFNLTAHPESYKDLLDLPEKLAQDKKITLVVCLDEFQNIEHFSESAAFQKRLRAQWQHHKNVAYCLYGSKRHMMTALFEDRSMPFYKFGDVFYMDKIPKKDFTDFIIEKFRQTKKIISESQAARITKLMECHPYYVQQLSYITWVNTGEKVTDEIIERSVQDLLDRNSLLYQKEFEQLSNTQINFLKALTEGVRSGFTSKDVIDKYQLGTSANVLRILEALEKKEVIDRFGGKIEFIDPGFGVWLERLWSN